MKLNRKLGLLLVAAAAVGSGAVTVAVAATTATSTTAPAPGGRHWHRHGGGMLVGTMLRATHQLNLTSDQQSAIKSLLSNARAQHSSQASTDVFTLANPGDPNYATALQSAKTAAASRLQSEVELQSQIYNILTADQKAQLPQVLADMKSKAEQRRAAWMQQHQTPTAGSN